MRRTVHSQPLAALFMALLTLGWASVVCAQGTQPSDDELFVSSGPETLVTLTFSMGFDTTEHYSDRDAEAPNLASPFSQLGPTDLAASALAGSVTGATFAGQGTLRSMIEITPPDTNFYAATSTAAFTDTVTVEAPGLEGQSGTLHLEYSIDGRATGTVNTLAAALSLTLIGEDNFELTEPFSQAFGTLGSPFDITFTPEDPLTTTLDVDIVFGEPLTYGASLGLTLLGEGRLDFADTVQFTDASITQGAGQPVMDAQLFSQAGMAYGQLNTIPEPTSTALVLIGLAAGGFHRRRARSPFP